MFRLKAAVAVVALLASSAGFTQPGKSGKQNPAQSKGANMAAASNNGGGNASQGNNGVRSKGPPPQNCPPPPRRGPPPNPPTGCGPFKAQAGSPG